MSQMVMDNIQAEAYRFIKDGTPMNERGPQWAEFTRLAIADARKQVEHEELLKVEKSERSLATKQGLSYDEWLEKAKKLYSIDQQTAVVTSIALGPDHGKTWECDSYVDARKRVLQLMRYKKYDHFVRGRDFKYDPDQANEQDNKV